VLECLNLTNCGITNEIIQLLFGEGRQCNYPLESLWLQRNDLSPNGLGVVLTFLQRIPTIEELWLDDTSLAREDIRLLSNSLQNMELTILQLSYNNIGNEEIEILLSADKCQRLESLALRGNTIATRGYNLISQFLSREGTSLKYLDIADNQPMNEEHAQTFVDSLPRQSTLINISFGNVLVKDERDELVCKAVGALKNIERLVCDTSSFISVLQSNHTILNICSSSVVSIDWAGRPDPLGMLFGRSCFLKKALLINDREGVHDKIRAKLKAFYFKGEFDIDEPFADIDNILMPKILEMFTRADAGTSEDSSIEYESSEDESSDDEQERDEISYMQSFNAVYRIIRNVDLPNLFTFPSRQDVEMRKLNLKISQLEKELESSRRENARLKSENEALQCANTPSKRPKI